LRAIRSACRGRAGPIWLHFLALTTVGTRTTWPVQSARFREYRERGSRFFHGPGFLLAAYGGYTWERPAISPIRQPAEVIDLVEFPGRLWHRPGRYGFRVFAAFQERSSLLRRARTFFGDASFGLKTFYLFGLLSACLNRQRGSTARPSSSRV